MSEHIANRVGRILSGSVNSIVDTLEGMAPEMIMEQAIREVDQAIDDVRAELGQVISTKHLATTRLSDENTKHEELSEKVRLAMAEGREDLAEAAVAKLLDIEAQIPVLEGSITQGREAESELESYIQALQARKREMEDDLRQFRTTLAQTVSGTDAVASGAGGNSIEDAVRKAEGAFDRVMEQSTGLPGGAGLGDRKSAQQLAELDDMARKNRIKERLASFKTDSK